MKISLFQKKEIAKKEVGSIAGGRPDKTGMSTLDYIEPYGFVDDYVPDAEISEL